MAQAVVVTPTMRGSRRNWSRCAGHGGGSWLGVDGGGQGKVPGDRFVEARTIGIHGQGVEPVARLASSCRRYSSISATVISASPSGAPTSRKAVCFESRRRIGRPLLGLLSGSQVAFSMRWFQLRCGICRRRLCPDVRRVYGGGGAVAGRISARLTSAQMHSEDSQNVYSSSYAA
jgi:hypothetical protein